MEKTINIEMEQNQKVDQPFVIGISGACGSGKTWFANKLREEIVKPVCIFALDCYSKDKDFVNELEFRYDNPQAIDYDKAYVDFSKLLHGISVNLPVYNYTSHQVVSERTWHKPSVIMIEGLYAFYDKRFLDAMDFKLWIEADEKIRIDRRIHRDINERGENLESVMDRHNNDSEPAYKKYYESGMMLADCIYINNAANSTPKIVSVLISYIDR